jgi:hypothetical protein
VQIAVDDLVASTEDGSGVEELTNDQGIVIGGWSGVF